MKKVFISVTSRILGGLMFVVYGGCYAIVMGCIMFVGAIAGFFDEILGTDKYFTAVRNAMDVVLDLAKKINKD